MTISSYWNKTKPNNTGDNINYSASNMFVAQVTQVFYADDNLNISNKINIEYEIEFYSDMGGQKTERARQMTGLFGTNDYEEKILEPNEFAFDGKKLETATPTIFKNGTQVVVLGLYGKINDFVILGALSHPRISEDVSEMKYSPATRSDGICWRKEFRGVYEEIDKQGAWKKVYMGSRTAAGVFERPETAPTVLQIDNTGALKFFDKEKQIINLDRTNKKLTIKQISDTIEAENGVYKSEEEGELVNSIELDKTNKKITTIAGLDTVISVEDGTAEAHTRTFKSGLNIKQDGAGDTVTITTAGGLTLTLNGAGDSVNVATAAGDTVSVTPGNIEVKENGGGALKLAGGKVALGNGDEILDLVSEVCFELSQSLGNLGYNLSNAAAFTALKARVDAIKGSL